MEIQDLDAMLQKAFDESTKIYQERGFKRRIGFGRSPRSSASTLPTPGRVPANPSAARRWTSEIIPGMQRLLEACRAQAATSSST